MYLKNFFKLLFLVFTLLFLLQPKEVSATGEMIKVAILSGEGENYHYAYRGTGRNFRSADINGDSYPDIIVGSRHYPLYGGVYIFNASQYLSDRNAINADIILRNNASDGHLLGSDIAVGDIDNDSKIEIIAGDYDTGLTYGHGFIFKTGSLFSSRDTLQSNGKITGLLNSYSSRGIEVVGDINGDNYRDLLYSGSDDGNIYIFYGSNTISSLNVSEADLTIDASVYPACLMGVGQSFGSEVDINNDGYDDLVIGCGMRPVNGGNGLVFIFYGSQTLQDKQITDADVVISASDSGVFKFGVDNASGDLNNDGYQDIAIKSDHFIYVYFGGKNFTSMTTADADVVITSDPNLGGDEVNNYLKGGIDITDINNDQIDDLVFSAMYLNKTYVLYGKSNFQSTNASSSDLIFDSSQYNAVYSGEQIETGDFTMDGYTDIAITDPNYQNLKGAVFVATPPHGTPQINITTYGGVSTSGKITGTVTDSYTHGGVEFSFDGGGWSNCDLSGDNFSCNLPSSSAGSNHTVRLRYKNIHGVYIPEREYKEVNFKFLTTAGNNSSTSCTTTLSPTLIPSITNLKPLNNSTSVELTLVNNDTTATEYIIEYGTTKTNLNYSALNIPVSSKTYTINKLNPTKQYYFRVRTTNGCGFGNWSSLTSIKNENSEVKTKETPLNSVTQNSVGQAKTKLNKEIKQDNEEQVTPIPTNQNQKTNILQTIVNWFVRILNRSN